MKFKIILENANEAQEFVTAATRCPADVDIQSGVVYIDGKSLLGVMALGICRELDVFVRSTTIDPSFRAVVDKYAIV